MVASALIDTLAAHLDESGRARSDAVDVVLDQVRALATSVRTARSEGRSPARVVARPPRLVNLVTTTGE